MKIEVTHHVQAEYKTWIHFAQALVFIAETAPNMREETVKFILAEHMINFIKNQDAMSILEAIDDIGVKPVHPATLSAMLSFRITCMSKAPVSSDQLSDFLTITSHLISVACDIEFQQVVNDLIKAVDDMMDTYEAWVLLHRESPSKGVH